MGGESDFFWKNFNNNIEQKMRWFSRFFDFSMNFQKFGKNNNFSLICSAQNLHDSMFSELSMTSFNNAEIEK